MDKLRGKHKQRITFDKKVTSSSKERGINTSKASPRKGGSIESISKESNRSARSQRSKKPITNSKSQVYSNQLKVKELESDSSPNRNQKTVMVEHVSSGENIKEKDTKTQSFKIEKRKGK